jgi:predicted PhzF superfamily epimerase YddE/YHI9
LRVDLFQIITFASDPHRGNPAFVLRDARDASETILASACDMLRTDVLAVIDGHALRFFTPQGPHPGAGHATLAAAHVALREGANGNGAAPGTVTFQLPGGDKRVARLAGGRIAIGFPLMPASRVEAVTAMAAALSARPAETWISPFGYIAVYHDAGTVASLRPDMACIAAFDRSAVIATAPGGSASDIVLRVFAPQAGLPEDPVCGTAHRIIVPYWAERMGKTCLHSRQLSARGGDLWCEFAGEDVVIAGESRLVIAGKAELPDA